MVVCFGYAVVLDRAAPKQERGSGLPVLLIGGGVALAVHIVRHGGRYGPLCGGEANGAGGSTG